jgi:glycosyltransferase involved in cell wall biosynthesis
MNVCFITKYPPIQGGVSTQCYWAARGLAERGHRVSVVTNANEVEDVFRIDLSPDDLAEGGSYQPQFPSTGGRVEVDSTERPDRSKIYYIPLGNPTVSRLVSRALRTVEEGHCDVIFSQYLEPYGLAASIVGAWTGTPFVFKHAGSDLFRLMSVPDLQPCYREVLRRAHRVITGGPAQKVVRSYGVTGAQIVTGFAFGLPKIAFRPDAAPADLNQMLFSARLRWADAQGALASLVAPLEPGLPVLGLYGKIGEQKGSFDLLHAARLLVDQGFAFHLVVLGRGWQEAEFGRLIAELGLARYVRMHPFIPHWRIPSFIRACDAVAFLERDFAIQAHTPTIPLEVLSCGACLIVSEEVLRKQMFRALARQHENLIVVGDPRDHGELARAIRFALENPARARSIGLAGHLLTEDLPDVAGYINGLEQVLQSVIAEPAPAPARLGVEERDERLEPMDVADRLYPYTTALLGPARLQVARAALSGSMIGSESIEPREFAVAVGERLRDAVESHGLDHVRDVCRYELLMHNWAAERDQAKEATGGAAAFDPAELALTSRICLRGDFAVESFEHDVEELAQMITRGEPIPTDASTRFRAERELLVLFHRGSFPQRISRPTAVLLSLLRDGSLSPAELRFRLTAALKVRPDHLAAADLADILQGLFWEGIIGIEAGASVGPAELTSESASNPEVRHAQEE